MAGSAGKFQTPELFAWHCLKQFIVAMIVPVEAANCCDYGLGMAWFRASLLGFVPTGSA